MRGAERNPAAPRLATTVKHGALSKREWQDVRRALQAQTKAGVHAVELHGVKITYAKKAPCFSKKYGASGKGEGANPAPARKNPHSSRPCANSAEQSTGASAPVGGNARQRRNRSRLLDFQQKKKEFASDETAMQA